MNNHQENLYNAVCAYKDGAPAQKVFSTLAQENKDRNSNPLKMASRMMSVACRMGHAGAYQDVAYAVSFARDLLRIATQDRTISDKDLLAGHERVMLSMLANHETLVGKENKVTDGYAMSEADRKNPVRVIFSDIAEGYYWLLYEGALGRDVLNKKTSQKMVDQAALIGAKGEAGRQEIATQRPEPKKWPLDGYAFK